MMPSLAVECLGRSLWIPAHPKLAAGEKAGKMREAAAAFPGWKPFPCWIVGCEREKLWDTRTCSSQLKAKRSRMWG